VSIHHIKADSSIWFFDCWSGQAATVLAISRSCILELTCPNGDARAAIREGSVAFVALCAPFLELESADEYGHDPTALQMKLQTGVERVYRMGAREVAQALQLLHSRLLKQITGRQSGALARFFTRFGTLRSMCALDFDQTITRVAQFDYTLEPDLAMLLGSSRVGLIQEMCRQLVQCGVVLCVVSLNVKIAIIPVLKKLGIFALMDGVYDIQDVAAAQGRKQNFMHHLMQMHNIQPENCVLVDDHPDNLVSAPCKTVQVQPGGIKAREVIQIFSTLGLLAQQQQQKASPQKASPQKASPQQQQASPQQVMAVSPSYNSITPPRNSKTPEQRSPSFFKEVMSSLKRDLKTSFTP
jgi:beta-phosphoglucomutase-like phosphatase (HAD superfamily)